MERDFLDAGDCVDGVDRADCADRAARVDCAVKEAADRTLADVLFDFAGVLVDWRPWRAFGFETKEALDAAAAAGDRGAQMAQRFFDRNDPQGFWALDDLRDAGMPNAEVCARYDAAHPDPALRGMYRTYLDAFPATVPAMMPGMAALLADLSQQGIGVWGLTNWSDEDVAVPRGLPGMDPLRGVIVSGREKLVKPDATIYRLALARFGLDARTTAFFDDKAENVAGAQAVGIRAHEFAGAQDARDFLRAGGITV